MSPPPTHRNNAGRWPARADGERSQQGPALQAAASAVAHAARTGGPRPTAGQEIAAGKGRSRNKDAAAMAGKNERRGGRPTPAGRGRRQPLVRAAPRTAHEARRAPRVVTGSGWRRQRPRVRQGPPAPVQGRGPYLLAASDDDA